jgi:peptidoglycan/xylan/chitin deacetylase (PgdA/CDA1 family)
MAGAIYYRGLRALGATALKRRFQDAGLVLCYHNIIGDDERPAGDPALHLSQTRFGRQMQWLSQHYAMLPLSQFVERLTRGRSLRETAVVTFDDGYAGVFEHGVPILKRLGIPATVFVVANAPGRSTGFWWDHPDIVTTHTAAQRDRWLNDFRGDEAAILAGRTVGRGGSPAAYRPADWTTIRAHVGSGIDIGAHSATHRSLPALAEAELQDEIVAGRTAIGEACGVWPAFFAYPYGLWNAQVRAAIRNAGYRGAVTVVSGLNRPGHDPWCLRRVNVPAQISDAAFEAWTAGFGARH